MLNRQGYVASRAKLLPPMVVKMFHQDYLWLEMTWILPRGLEMSFSSLPSCLSLVHASAIHIVGSSLQHVSL